MQSLFPFYLISCAPDADARGDELVQLVHIVIRLDQPVGGAGVFGWEGREDGDDAGGGRREEEGGMRDEDEGEGGGRGGGRRRRRRRMKEKEEEEGGEGGGGGGGIREKK